MWRETVNAVRELLFLREQTHKNASDIFALQKDFKELASDVQDLKHEARVNRNDESHERVNMALGLENELLKFERRLPPPN